MDHYADFRLNFLSGDDPEMMVRLCWLLKSLARFSSILVESKYCCLHFIVGY